MRRFSQCHSNSLTLLHFPTAQLKYPPSQASTKNLFCCDEGKEIHNFWEFQLCISDSTSCLLSMGGGGEGGRLDKKHLMSIINLTFAIESDLTR